ncbi:MULTISPECIES: hypothetical protein [Rhodococcus]|uniref:Guanylate cyclase n=1 Tax=Rhodococcus oxybenzonivorans TaxID=1990687 RepID=A0AAE5A682_9NOCA|nr:MULTISPECIES: hypothetical protein [Rhodococcus]MDV7244952.1 hypothetical protein [Rhodococcus oxybenzonivorans]MDV7264923.1 hypothetical protein [Rhodococcus oxybenzonivorans]MDV7275549.1 hypothetical protein [Rhodococcus oxybenzonivorans]MDV7332326.1 hypothetical protein [Rhodococcus oxybenzonivorans]MDV7346122.1 hypothetical protein [Rhodococcus oxybenzonivorans]
MHAPSHTDARSAGSRIDLDTAVNITRTGDIWIFRGESPADRAIQTLTNSPVNHVGMSVVLEDLPPLMWHAELGHSLQDMWTGRFQRGVQLHDLRAAVQVWGARYGQRGWLRQLAEPATREQEDALMRTIARLDGTPFPSTAKLASRWFGGRLPLGRRARRRSGSLESAYCAEVVATTYEEMGLLAGDHRTSWYDPGKFWSGDRLPLVPGVTLGREIEVVLSDADLAAGRGRRLSEGS